MDDWGHGMPDAWELLYPGCLDPFDPTDWQWDCDGDGDGYINIFEYAYWLDPTTPDSPHDDSDGDGIPDECEIQMDTDPFDPLEPPYGLDSDHDGVWDAFEVCVFQTNPFNADTDFDGMPDGWEIMYNLNPNSSADKWADPDGDGIPNLIEYLNGRTSSLHHGEVLIPQPHRR